MIKIIVDLLGGIAQGLLQVFLLEEFTGTDQPISFGISENV
jgi:hypothetical protein